MPERNVELLEKTMQHIMDHPEQHNQGWWHIKRATSECGTAACFAGWAVQLEGYKPVFVRRDSKTRTSEVALPGPRGGVTNRPTRNTCELAQEVLGLTLSERGTLFRSDNTRPMLQLMVKDLVNGDELRDAGHYEEEAEK